MQLCCNPFVILSIILDSLSEVGLLTPAGAELDPCIVGRWVGGGQRLQHRYIYIDVFNDSDDDVVDNYNNDDDDDNLFLSQPLH